MDDFFAHIMRRKQRDYLEFLPPQAIDVKITNTLMCEISCLEHCYLSWLDLQAAMK